MQILYAVAVVFLWVAFILDWINRKNLRSLVNDYMEMYNIQDKTITDLLEINRELINVNKEIVKEINNRYLPPGN